LGSSETGVSGLTHPAVAEIARSDWKNWQPDGLPARRTQILRPVRGCGFDETVCEPDPHRLATSRQLLVRGQQDGPSGMAFKA
jgi:hypothetical protein